ncbi:MAG: MOSC domain-containing protein, partial [Candidatus Latescibacteria bacterium]|nr:MOSC domain-containing protein [Candidatus Latescibacterota bacterium]
ILAGDQLFVDFDIREDNLAPGDLLKVGPAAIKISSVPHTGCKLFRERYGVEALNFFNSDIGSALRLRGVFGQIVQAGVVTVGDIVEKG